MANIELNGYRIDIQDEQALTVREAYAASLTMDRGLHGTSHNLRSNVFSLLHQLNDEELVDEDGKDRMLPDELRGPFLRAVQDFNQLKPNSLNTKLLDNKKLPKDASPAPQSPEPKGKAPAPQDPQPADNDEPKSDDSQAPAWFAEYTKQFGATDKDGKPTKAAAQSEVKKLDGGLKLLGIEFKDGEAAAKKGGLTDQLLSHEDRLKALENTQSHDNKPLVWVPTIVAVIAAFALFWIVLGFGQGMIWAIGVAVAALLMGIAIFIFTNRTNTRPAR